ncbi:hypothetical protein GCM10017784_37120 [Deinococcus indicus]|nr:hypothetical protein GCM10017784_37120 [Deinococcus indicus]
MKGGRGYKRVGDAFSRAVQEGRGPRTVTACTCPRTGRTYYRRVSVQECSTLSAAALPALWGQPGSGVQGVAWNPATALFKAHLIDREVPGEGWVQIRFTVGSERARVGLTCPHCGRTCRALHAAPTDHQGHPATLVGCRACLGLTDAARQRHKCPDWAASVLHRAAPTSDTTTRRALQVMEGTASRFVRHLGLHRDRLDAMSAENN